MFFFIRAFALVDNDVPQQGHLHLVHIIDISHKRHFLYLLVQKA